MNQSSQPPHAFANRTIEFLFHVFLAALLGPYLVGIAFSLLELRVLAEFQPAQTLLVYPLQILFSGFPIIFLFTVLSFFPLLAVLRINNRGIQRSAFLAVGGFLGFLVGGTLAWLIPGAANGVMITTSSVLVGVGCGFLDWLVWR